eukprot:scaffold510_cov242-Pinguiococcus_pyrenoidosus.AAC.21
MPVIEQLEGEDIELHAKARDGVPDEEEDRGPRRAENRVRAGTLHPGHELRRHGPDGQVAGEHLEQAGAGEDEEDVDDAAARREEQPSQHAEERDASHQALGHQGHGKASGPAHVPERGLPPDARLVQAQEAPARVQLSSGRALRPGLLAYRAQEALAGLRICSRRGGALGRGQISRQAGDADRRDGREADDEPRVPHELPVAVAGVERQIEQRCRDGAGEPHAAAGGLDSPRVPHVAMRDVHEGGAQHQLREGVGDVEAEGAQEGHGHAVHQCPLHQRHDGRGHGAQGQPGPPAVVSKRVPLHHHGVQRLEAAGQEHEGVVELLRLRRHVQLVGQPVAVGREREAEREGIEEVHGKQGQAQAGRQLPSAAIATPGLRPAASPGNLGPVSRPPHGMAKPAGSFGDVREVARPGGTCLEGKVADLFDESFKFGTDGQILVRMARARFGTLRRSRGREDSVDS